jgi:mannose-6-phosphate isomerase-like protein (cupin superfamily)
MSGIVIGPGEGEKLPRGSREHRILAELPELEIVDECFGPGFTVEPHVHDDHADVFYMLEGEAEFTLGDEIVHAGAGTLVAAPRGSRHGFRNVGDADLRVLNIHAPTTGFANRLRRA